VTGRKGAEDGAASVKEIWALQVHLAINDEELLLPTTVGNNLVGGLRDGRASENSGYMAR